MAVLSAPVDWVELVSQLRLPPKADRRLQELMDRNTEGQLTEEERADLESLVGQTPHGRATIVALGMNRPALVAIRRTLAVLGRFPPTTRR